ncbi:Het and ankyrin domain protein [Rutstroemia sp. NJR-2017a BBW]|nr:Het and ankyrin domain protein [Rutstroemia sp. NJR-2017a BBW]
MKYKGYCNLDLELTELGTSDESVPGVQNFSRDLLGENALVLGFPIRGRPEGYPGLEVSFDTLLHYLQATKAEIFGCNVLIKGPNRVLKLIKHIDDIFFWQLDHSLADYSLCCPDKRSRTIAIQDYSSLDHYTLEVGRHILSKCADDITPAKERWELLSQSSNMLSTDSQPSPTTESLEDSLDSDMYSISDSSDDVKLLDHEESIYPILNKILHRLLAGFRTVTQYQSSPSKSGGYSAPVGSTNESAHTGNTSRSSYKRKSQQDEDDGTGEDGSQPPPLKKLKSGEGEEPQKSFSCPYLKWNPIKYSSCCVKIFSRISDVKQHLRRKHTPKRYCQVCLKTNFENEESLNAHNRTGLHSWRDPATLEGISYDQREKLSKKSKHGTSEEDKWFMIWEILFSRDKRPTSVYIDTDLTLEMRQFQAYCERRGPVLMTEQIESDQAWLSLETTREQRTEYLERVIAQGFQTLFNDWRVNAPSSSITPERQSNNNTRDSRSKTPTSSLVDSGVMIGSSSSRETGFQGREIYPASRIPAMGITFQLSAADIGARRPSPIQEDAAAPTQI